MKCSRPGIWASSEEQFESMGDKNTIGRFYSRCQHLYKFIWKKKKTFAYQNHNSTATGLYCNFNMAAVSFFGTPLWPPWRPCGNILYSSEVCICFPITHSRLSIVTHPLVASARPLWLSSHLPCPGSLKEERTIEKLTLCYTTLWYYL